MHVCRVLTGDKEYETIRSKSGIEKDGAEN